MKICGLNVVIGPKHDKNRGDIDGKNTIPKIFMGSSWIFGLNIISDKNGRNSNVLYFFRIYSCCTTASSNRHTKHRAHSSHKRCSASRNRFASSTPLMRRYFEAPCGTEWATWVTSFVVYLITLMSSFNVDIGVRCAIHQMWLSLFYHNRFDYKKLFY